MKVYAGNKIDTAGYDRNENRHLYIERGRDRSVVLFVAADRYAGNHLGKMRLHRDEAVRLALELLTDELQEATP